MSDPYETADAPLRSTNAPPPFMDSAEAIERIGRYRVERILGKGGFGLVFLAYDEQLERRVAIKVPRRDLMASARDVEIYLAEARTAAALDHANIVPVFDVGSSAEHPCYIVSKFIEGDTLARKIHDERVSVRDMCEIIAAVADALHYAHGRGVIHRDIKPGNILLDAAGKPFVGDFGLALTDESSGRGAGYVGTPAYMSPEQARGEGHRVDGRSDIFSLGIVLYELLTGRHPFPSDTADDLREQIVFTEPRSMRQWDDAIPLELDRICSKAMAKRTSERYTTAKDLADDLRHFLQEQPVLPPSVSTASRPPMPRNSAVVSETNGVSASTPNQASVAMKIVPQGLRSFGAHEADFFLELLPGPRDRLGLPDSLRFWKTRIEELDADETFAVGLIYGPSGCGKSSLMKAGLLPRLADHVIPVYVEATGQETEKRILNGLRKRCPALPDLSLKDTLAALRRGQGFAAGKKILIVLDQFEQWLHAAKDTQKTELLQALRQCDGARLQCIVMVRDDFWMAATRFMRDLEIRLLEGHNSAAVDLFDLDHAQKVLTAFGRAYGKLPDKPNEKSKDQKVFLNQVVAALAQEGKVICVRLALFAEMMKGKPWTLAALKEVGGAEGIGVTFLEETFSAATAPPEHRYHQKAIRAVLTALSPEAGADIKGHMRSRAELLHLSGYADRPGDFDDLIRILDAELRLITPTDPDGKERTDDSMPSAPQERKYYQLTHDYLVHSVRDWLARKQKETRRGRAELLLADRAADWNARPENRQLPSAWQWLRIRILTRPRDWSESQKKMMRQANRFHLVRGGILAVVLIASGLFAYEGFGRLKAHALRDRLLNANITDVPAVVKDMAPYRRWTEPLLREALNDAETNHDARRRLQASLALLPTDAGQKDYLVERLLSASPQEIVVLIDALSPYRESIADRLWAAAEQPAKGKEHERLRAASALARFDPEGQRWSAIRDGVASDLVAVPTVFLETWMLALRPARKHLREPLSAIFRDPKRRETERSLATDLLADYAGDEPLVLAELLLDADAQQFAALFSKLEKYPDQARAAASETAAILLASRDTDDEKDALANRQANAAVVLLKLGQSEPVWPLLKHGADPRTRSLLIHRLAPLGIDPEILLGRFDAETDVAIQRALLLSLSLFDGERLGQEKRASFIPKALAVYRGHPDAGLHAAAEWLLRQWRQEDKLLALNEEWATDAAKRATRMTRLTRELDSGRAPWQASWYVNGQGQTIVVIPRPPDFVWMGSPATESGREEGKMETRHKKRIGRSFAIAAKEVTVEQFLRFRAKHAYNPQYAPKSDCPVNRVNWYQAAAYCNWLSEQEGIPKSQWCYLPNAAGEFADGMKMAPGYLKLTGYRLPTEAEWEYACRAGAATARYFGENGDLLEQYAWYTKNTLDRDMKPVGTLKPNDFGLFDMLGNALEWCQDPSREYPPASKTPLADKEQELSVANQQYRALRSGAFYYALVSNRSANRSRNFPNTQANYIGFRPARTIR